MNMKKILFMIGACLTLTFASCTCKTAETQSTDQDTVYVDDTVYVEEADTLFVEE